MFFVFLMSLFSNPKSSIFCGLVLVFVEIEIKLTHGLIVLLNKTGLPITDGYNHIELIEYMHVYGENYNKTNKCVVIFSSCG